MVFALVLNAPTLDVEIQEKLIIAADGGYRHVENKPIYAVIGDFDTLGYIPKNVLTVTHPTDKDQTDGELSLDFIKNEGGKKVTIYGALGGKIEHVLGNVNLLAYANEIGLDAKIIDKNNEIYFVRDTLTIETLIGNNLSLFPFGGEVEFESSTGLKYPLDNLKILPHSSLGISNEVTVGKVEIKVKKGSAIAVISKKLRKNNQKRG